MQNLKKALLQGGCAVALALGTLTTAHAQVGGSLGLGVVGKAGSGKSDFGFHGEAWIGAGGFGGYLAGGSNDGEAFGEFGAGARFMVGGNVGVGALLTFAAQDGEDSNKMFYAVKPTVEVGIDGLTFTTTMQIPVGKKERSANNGYGNVELRDQPTKPDCSNPMNPNARVCVPYLVGRENGKEENRFGVDLNAAYRLDLGGFYVTPQIGVGVYDRAQGKNLVRFHAGAVAGLGFGSGLAFEGGIHVKHDNKSTSADRDGKTQAVFSAGLTWHFGGQGANPASDFVNRSFNRTPFNKGVVSSTSLGKSFDERFYLTDSNNRKDPVQLVRFLDGKDLSPQTRIQDLNSNEVLVILGDNGEIKFDTTSVTISKAHTYFIGGGSQVKVSGINGHTGTWLTPGTRPTITAGNLPNQAILVNGAENVMLKGFDMVGDSTTPPVTLIKLASSPLNVIDDLSLKNANERLLQVTNSSNNTRISNIKGSGVGKNVLNGVGIEVDASKNVVIENLTLTEMGANSVGVNFIGGSDNGILRNFSISDNDNNYFAGVRVAGSIKLTIEQGTISGGARGIMVLAQSDQTTINNVRIADIGSVTATGLMIDKSKNVSISNVDIVNISKDGTGVGLQVQNDSGVLIQNVHVSGVGVGFNLTDGAGMTEITDLGGNTFTAANAMQKACDGTTDIKGKLTVTVTNDGKPATCD